MRTHSLYLRVAAAGVTAACAAALLLAAGPAAAAPAGKARHAPMDIGARERSLGIQQVPKGSANSARRATAAANPYLADGADPATVDWSTWQANMAVAGKAREASRAAPPSPLEVSEAENGAAGTNNTAGNAELISELGTGSLDNPAAELTGELAAPASAPVAIPSAAEDNGSITLAGRLELATKGTTKLTGVLGDGPHGIGSNDEVADGTGDFDFYRVDGDAGDFVTIDLDTPSGGSLDSVLVLWTAAGQSILSNDDFGGSTDSLLTYQLPTNGPFYVSVAGFGDSVPYDPFDSSTGFGGGSTGDYSLTASTRSDVDTYAVNLDPGDVLGLSVTGAAGRLEVHDPADTLVLRSAQDTSAIYPASSPLPGGGNAVLAYVADSGGHYTFRVLGGQGDYQVRAEVYRAGGGTTHVIQRIYLDFDNLCVNTGVFGSSRGDQTLSPMSSFLPNWGLLPSDKSAVISAVVATVKENLSTDPRMRNSTAVIKVLNSRDNKDPMGQPGVSRVIVGGTVDQFGFWTVGLAQSVDPGNFAPGESAVVLLDQMSAPAANNNAASLNGYMTSRSDRIAFIGHALGNVVSHEAGHLLGSFHTDQSDAMVNLMDQGGNAATMYGVGPDGIGGTSDDVDVDFGDDAYSPAEGLAGTQDTMAVTAFGLTKG
jgi:hypothetical protein